MLLMYGEVYQLQHFDYIFFHQGAVSECSDIVTENRSTISLPKKAQRRSIDIALLFL